MASLPPSAEEPRLEITFGPRACRLPPEPCDLADGDVRAWWKGNELLLGHGPFAAEVSATTAHIGGDGNLVRGFRQLLPYVISHLLQVHGRFVLHGGAIQREGRALLVLGGSGSGKSTLVVSALAAGWEALGDDLVAVRLGHAGPEVMGIAKPLAVPADVARSDWFRRASARRRSAVGGKC